MVAELWVANHNAYRGYTSSLHFVFMFSLVLYDTIIAIIIKYMGKKEDKRVLEESHSLSPHEIYRLTMICLLFHILGWFLIINDKNI